LPAETKIIWNISIKVEIDREQILSIGFAFLFSIKIQRSACNIFSELILDS